MFKPYAYEHDVPSEPDAIGRILIDAAHLIRIYGLAKRSSGNTVLGFCQGGAISAAQKDDFADPSASCHLWFTHEALACAARMRATLQLGPEWDKDEDGGDNYSLEWGRLVNWNNHSSRTRAEVIDALESAAFHELVAA